MKFEKSLKTFYVPPSDPELEFKRSAMTALRMSEAAAGEAADIADVSGIEKLGAEELERTLADAAQALIAPWQQAEAMKLDVEKRNRLLAAWPFRCWGAAQNAKAFREAGNAGELVSFRIFLNCPKARQEEEWRFKSRLLPALLDLCEYISGAEAETLHLNAAEGKNNVFALAKLKGNIVAELDVNEAMPDSLEPLRIVHAYFREGALTNLPLAGFTNFEGALFATDSSVERPVYENASWPEGDELKNLYFRMLWTIRKREYPAGISNRFASLERLVAEAFETRDPVQARKEAML